MTHHQPQFLGQGSFGRVERVCWNDRWFARKSMLRAAEDEGLDYASIRECDIYSRFSSPFMTTIYRMEIDSSHQVCLWMGLAEMSLAKYIESKPAFGDRVRLSGQVLWSALNFLHYIHAYNVLHRDIKPDNILLQSTDHNQYHIYLADMGSCRWWSHTAQKLTGGMGTRCYRPPEMETNHYGKPADVYGLAVTVIHLLHGIHPVQGFNPPTSPTQWQTTLAAYKAYIPSALSDLLRCMIKTKPAERIAVADALRHHFFQDAPVPPVPQMMAVPHPGHYWTRLHSTADQRARWIERIVDITQSYKFSAWTTVHAVHLYDDFGANCHPSALQRQEALEVYAYAAAWLAAKYFEEYAMPLAEMVAHCKQRWLVDDFVQAEEAMITTLHFRIVRRPPPKSLAPRDGVVTLKKILCDPNYTVGHVATRRSPRLAQ